MAIKRMFMDVLMDAGDGAETEHRVRVTLGDQLRAELEGKKHGLTTDHPMHITALWAWAAMTREGLFDGKFADFKSACLEAAPDKDAAGDLVGEPVDPTPPGPSIDSV